MCGIGTSATYRNAMAGGCEPLLYEAANVMLTRYRASSNSRTRHPIKRQPSAQSKISPVCRFSNLRKSSTIRPRLSKLLIYGYGGRRRFAEAARDLCYDARLVHRRNQRAGIVTSIAFIGHYLPLSRSKIQ